MPDIKVPLDELQETVIALTQNKLSDIDTAMTNCCTAIGTLTFLGWEGEAKDSFIDNFTEFKKEMRIFYQNLERFSGVLEEIHSDGEEIYDDGKNLINKLQ